MLTRKLVMHQIVAMLFTERQNPGFDQMKAFADKFNIAGMMILVFNRVENIVTKGENAAICLRVIKARDCVVKKES